MHHQVSNLDPLEVMGWVALVVNKIFVGLVNNPIL